MKATKIAKVIVLRFKMWPLPIAYRASFVRFALLSDSCTVFVQPLVILV